MQTLVEAYFFLSKKFLISGLVVKGKGGAIPLFFHFVSMLFNYHKGFFKIQQVDGASLTLAKYLLNNKNATISATLLKFLNIAKYR